VTDVRRGPCTLATLGEHQIPWRSLICPATGPPGSGDGPYGEAPTLGPLLTELQELTADNQVGFEPRLRSLDDLPSYARAANTRLESPSKVPARRVTTIYIEELTP